MLEYRYDTQLLNEGCSLSEDALAETVVRRIPGDSLLAVGDATLMKVHYHTNVPWRLLKLCASMGEIFDIVVEDMDRQARGLQG